MSRIRQRQIPARPELPGRDRYVLIRPVVTRSFVAVILAVFCTAAGPVPVTWTPGEDVSGDIHKADRARPDVLLGAMEAELDRSFTELKDAGETPLYFLSYGLTETAYTRIVATLGAVGRESSSRNRYLDVDVRVGSMDFDNTRESRTFYSGLYREPVKAPLDDDPLVLRVALWGMTDQTFKAAQERYANLRTEASLESERDDPSGDFSPTDRVDHIEPLKEVSLDFDVWRDLIRSWSAMFHDHPDIHQSTVELEVSTTDKYIVTSEGTKVVTSAATARIVVYAWTKADDGMPLYLYQIYDVNDSNNLPAPETVRADITRLIGNLEALREAPVVDPYSGPAILKSQAAAVYFHEIFGHRVEGHRQKSEEEGQTFTDKVGEQVLPEFIDVYDDPTLEEYAGEDLKGHYTIDDEGVRARRADIVVDGELKGFLMSRNPIKGFPTSTGHGRRQPGLMTVARQGNLVIESSNIVSYEALREELIRLIKEQDKPYGLIFGDISGGFTSTRRWSPQSFSVQPLLVYRVYPDGRPDELVRGVDIVGTPLTSFSKIVVTADDPGIFDGYCGAESGSCPVSAVSPSLLISEMEVEKQAKSPTGPPELPMPPMELPDEPPSYTESAEARRALTSDPVLRAMGDELDRNMNELRLPDSEEPYHLIYRIDDLQSWAIQATFGGLVDDMEGSVRTGTITLRVGDMEFDNTQFQGMGLGRPGWASTPIEDHYGAVRHALWIGTDNTYRSALAQLAAKRAFVQNNIVKDKPDDFTPASPVVHVDRREAASLDRDKWRRVAREVSALFRSEEGVQNAGVWVHEARSSRRMVNSDGTVVRQTGAHYVLLIVLQTQAEDGMPLTNYKEWSARSPGDLPNERTILSEARGLLEEIEELVASPEGDPYVGPLILVGQASGEFFAQLLAQELSSPREPLMERESFFSRAATGALANRLNRRILPTSFQVIDDPTADSWKGTELLGHYMVDDEGVVAERLDLIQDGWLRDLPMSRVPTRDLKESNGHGRASSTSFAVGRPSNLMISSSEPQSMEELKAQLIELARLSQSPFGMMVTRLQVPFIGSIMGGSGLVLPILISGSGSAISSPLLAYRVYVEDGRTEVVRGYKFEEISVRTMKDILGATSNETLVQTLLTGSPGRGMPVSVVAPDVLIEEVVLTPIKGQRPKPPYLSRPLPEMPDL